MSYSNQYQDSISTVQLSPFGEDHWNRIVTYSPIYLHWTDMLMMSEERTNKNTSGKLNLMNRIDLNALKLEDEMLLNEIYHIRRSATELSKGKNKNPDLKVSDDEQDQQAASSTEDYQGSSEFFHEAKEPVKHYCSYSEPSFLHQQYHPKRSVTTYQTIPPQVNGTNQIKNLPNISLGPKPQPALGVQLRQSTIAREHALSATYDRHLSTPLSLSTSKRTMSSAHSSHPSQQQYRTLQSPLSNEADATNHNHEQIGSELSANSVRKARAKSTNSSRSTMNMLKTKNDRTRQKQNIQLKTVLVEPWKQPIYMDGILDEPIPNSLEIMHKMCGPATPFERNLRDNFHRQLNQFRSSSMKS